MVAATAVGMVEVVAAAAAETEMHDELAEIRDFLAEVPPFHQLEEAGLQELSRVLVIRYLRRGSAFPPPGEPHLWIIRQGAVELRQADGRLGGHLAEGEVFDACCLPDSELCHWAGHATEDSLLYGLPKPRLEHLWQQHPELHAQALDRLGSRLRRARQMLESSATVQGDLAGQALGSLVSRTPVCASPQTPIKEAASLMTRERVSALLLVEDACLVGIVTDRDLRSRCLADGVDTASPVEAIMTRAPFSLPPDAPAFEALLTMSTRGIHHLPVVSDCRVLGLVSSTDLLRAQGLSAVFLADRLRKATSLDELVGHAATLPELWLTLARRGDSPASLGRLMAGMADALARSLLALAEARLGPPPVPYAWIAYGSHGRQELTLFSDQDNALVLDDAYDPAIHGAYFQALAESVCEGLAACGFILCPGNMMASNPLWRQSREAWGQTFQDWIVHADPQKARLAANLFDFRPVCGDPALTGPLRELITASCVQYQSLLAHMVANTLTRSPPLGFFRQFLVARDGEHQGQLDLKFHGLMPIHELARIHALAAGCAETGTVARLQAVAGSALLSREGAADLLAAHDFLQALRLTRQRQQREAGLLMDNYVAPETLSPLERQHLRDAFQVIRTQQQALQAAFPAARAT